MEEKDNAYEKIWCCLKEQRYKIHYSGTRDGIFDTYSMLPATLPDLTLPFPVTSSSDSRPMTNPSLVHLSPQSVEGLIANLFGCLRGAPPFPLLLPVFFTDSTDKGSSNKA